MEYNEHITRVPRMLFILSLPIILLCCTNTINAQNDYFATSIEYTTENGLGGRFANFTYKDSRGLLWLGTQYGGLHRFDGRDFKIFNEENGLPFNQVMEIYEDKEGWLWLYRSCVSKDKDYCFKALAFFHHITHEVLTFEERFGENPPFIPTDIEAIVSNPANGDICIVTALSTFLWTSKEGFRILPANHIDKRPYIFTILENENMGAFYKNETQSIYYLLNKDGEVLKQELISQEPFHTNEIYIPNSNHRNVIAVGNPEKSGYILNVSAYKVDSSGNLQLYQPHEIVKILKPGVGGHHIFFDEERQAFWDASARGFKVVFLQKKRFKHILLQSKKSWVERIFLLGEEQIFHRRGIYNYKTEQEIQRTPGTYEFQILFPQFNKNQFRAAEQIAISKNGQTFLVKNKKIVGFDNIMPFLPSNSFSTINHYKKIKESYWFCTESGLWHYDIQNDSLKKFDKVNGYENFISCFVQEIIHFEDDKYWVITNEGLFLLSLSKGILAKYSSNQKGQYYIPSDNLYHLAQMQDGTLWLATFKGLLHLSIAANKPVYKEQHYELLTTKDGLPTNICASLFPDKHGFLWTATAKGLVQMNLASKKMKVYTKRDGLELDFFLEHAHYQAPDGEIFFGGLGGIVHFHPDDFANEILETADVPLIIVDFEQYNKSLEKFETKTASILKDRKVILSPDAQLFNIRVALEDYRNAGEQRFAYRINGYQDEWLEDKSNVMNISGLPYGNHQMEIKGRLADGRYSKNVLALEINVLRPFYLQWWFILLSISAIGSLIYFRFRELRKRQIVLEKTVQERTSQIQQDKQIIEEQATELRQLDKVKSRFFANVSHELRTPLTLILSPISSALKRNRLENQDFTLLKLAQQSGQNLLRLVNEILDLSKLEASKLELVEAPTVLYLLLRRTASSFESLAERQNTQFQFDYQAKQELQVLLDADKFQKIVNNLLSNAFKFTSKDGIVHLSLADKGEQILLKVADSGMGIRAEDLPYVFDRFYQSKNPNEAAQGGTGIGLALCKEFSKLFKGKLRVESVVGKGSTFYFEFPKKEILQSLPTDAALELKDIKAPIESSPSNTSENIISPIPVNKPISAKTILLVEDNHSLRDYLQLILKEHYQIITAENGAEALERLTGDGERETGNNRPPTIVNRQPSLIISDVMMPIMDGFQLLEKLKANDDWRHIPVVMLTARAELGDRLKALRIGVDDYITKPFEEEELLTRVSNLIGNLEERANWVKNILPESGDSKPRKDRPILSQEDAAWLADLEIAVQQNMASSGFNVESLSEVLFLSRRQLQRRIKQLTGLSPNQYIQEARLQEARNLLENRIKSSVKSVCAAIGVKDAKHFSGQFKKRFGKVPSEYF